MAPADKIEHASTAELSDHGASAGDGLKAGTGQRVTSPVLGEGHDRTHGRAKGGRTNFASVGGWVVSR